MRSAHYGEVWDFFRSAAIRGSFELLPKAKALRPDVPVIMITAYGDAETKRRALENGAEARLTKPIDFGRLDAIMKSRRSRRSSDLLGMMEVLTV